MMRTGTGHRRWMVPAAVVLAVGAGVGGMMISASATPELPPKTAAQLLVDLHQARVDGVSGTVVENADLGLPAIPVPGGGQGSSDLTSLISGSHTLRVWYGGPDRVRVALLGTLGESDVIRDGTDLWTWSSQQNEATHVRLPAEGDRKTGPARHGDGGAAQVPLTPQQAAQRALAAIDPSTKVSVDGTASVAGRDAYELVLAPRDARSLIGQVRIAVDARTHVPLRVRVIARGATSPAFGVGFTHVSFTRPDAAEFRFRPPPGARISNSNPFLGSARDHQGGTETAPTTVGTGWTQVTVLDGVGPIGPGRQGGAGGPGGGSSLTQVLGSLPHVSGSWGSGRVLSSSLFTALLTDDGRLIVGAVRPDLVYQAAAHR